MSIKDFKWPDRAFNDSLGGGKGQSSVPQMWLQKARVPARDKGWSQGKAEPENGASRARPEAELLGTALPLRQKWGKGW